MSRVFELICRVLSTWPSPPFSCDGENFAERINIQSTVNACIGQNRQQPMVVVRKWGEDHINKVSEANRFKHLARGEIVPRSTSDMFYIALC
jgi:hypothetical protein